MLFFIFARWLNSICLETPARRRGKIGEGWVDESWISVKKSTWGKIVSFQRQKSVKVWSRSLLKFFVYISLTFRRIPRYPYNGCIHLYISYYTMVVVLHPLMKNMALCYASPYIFYNNNIQWGKCHEVQLIVWIHFSAPFATKNRYVHSLTLLHSNRIFLPFKRCKDKIVCA